MRKVFLLFVALLTFAPVFAQTESDESDFIGIGKKEKSNAFFLGPKVGGTFTTMTQPDEGKLYDSPDFGYSAGIALKTRFGKASDNSAGGTGFWGIGLELKYRLNSVKTFGTDEDGNINSKLTIGYFNVPVYAQIYPFAKTSSMNSFYVELGASIAGTMSRTPKSLTVANPSEDFSSVTYYLDAKDSKLKGFDVSPMVGIGYTIPGTGLDINARYTVGMSKLAGNFPCKMSNVEVSLAWMFDIWKF